MKIHYQELQLTITQSEMQILSKALEMARCKCKQAYVGQGLYTDIEGWKAVEISAVADFIDKFRDVTG